MAKPKDRICAVTITFGNQAETALRMPKIGTELGDGDGFTGDDLCFIAQDMKKKGFIVELMHLKKLLNPIIAQAEKDGNILVAGAARIAAPAHFLLIKRGADAIVDVDGLHNEMAGLDYDNKFIWRSKLANRHARHCLVVGDVAQACDLEGKGNGTVLSFDALPHLAQVRKQLPRLLGPKAENLYAELNHYYDPKKTGIRHHGDTERRITVGMAIGKAKQLVFLWFYRNDPYGVQLEFTVEEGDIYIMSEKSTGYDWRSPSKFTLRHAAGWHQGKDEYLIHKKRKQPQTKAKKPKKKKRASLPSNSL